MPGLNRHLSHRDLSGRKFGAWEVLRLGSIFRLADGKPRWRWLCRCACGAEEDVLEGNLERGSSRSCGCRSWEPRIDRIRIRADRMRLNEEWRVGGLRRFDALLLDEFRDVEDFLRPDFDRRRAIRGTIEYRGLGESSPDLRQKLEAKKLKMRAWRLTRGLTRLARRKGET